MVFFQKRQLNWSGRAGNKGQVIILCRGVVTCCDRCEKCDNSQLILVGRSVGLSWFSGAGKPSKFYPPKMGYGFVMQSADFSSFYSQFNAVIITAEKYSIEEGNTTKTEIYRNTSLTLLAFLVVTFLHEISTTTLRCHVSKALL